METKNNEETKLKLSNVKVIFANFKDEGFGTSITIDATEPEVKKSIEAWVKKNNIGKGEKAGIANLKEYTPEDGKATTQYAFKINSYTKFASKEGEWNNDLCGFGSTISLVANAFEVDNKFMKGVSSCLQAVVLVKEKETAGQDSLNELLEEITLDETAE